MRRARNRLRRHLQLCRRARCEGALLLPEERAQFGVRPGRIRYRRAERIEAGIIEDDALRHLVS